MDCKDRIKFVGREFLNKPGFHSGSNIYCSISQEFYSSKCDSKYPDYLEVEFNIFDCSRAITLTFDTDNKEDRENSIYKVNTMIDVLTKFRDGMITEFKAWEEIERLKEEEKKLKKDKDTDSKIGKSLDELKDDYGFKV